MIEGTGPLVRTALIGALLSVALAALGGCTAIRLYNAEAPSVSVTGIGFDDFAFAEQSLSVTVVLHNPNAFALPIDGVDYSFRLGGEKLASGASEAAVTVPANGRETVRLNVGGNLLEALARYRQWRRAGRERVDYRLSGQIRLAGVPVGLPFSRTDSVALTPP